MNPNEGTRTYPRSSGVLPWSTAEKFLVPYVLEGEVRAYNQRMLAGWRSFDWRTRHTGPVDRELRASLMEPLF